MNLDSNRYDSLATAVRIYEYIWEEEKPLNYFADERHPDSQMLPSMHRISNGAYIASKKKMLEKGYFLGDKPKLIEIPKVCAIDIDNIEDYYMASDAWKWYSGTDEYLNFIK